MWNILEIWWIMVNDRTKHAHINSISDCYTLFVENVQIIFGLIYSRYCIFKIDYLNQFGTLIGIRIGIGNLNFWCLLRVYSLCITLFLLYMWLSGNVMMGNNFPQKLQYTFRSSRLQRFFPLDIFFMIFFPYHHFIQQKLVLHIVN